MSRGETRRWLIAPCGRQVQMRCYVQSTDKTDGWNDGAFVTVL